MRRYLCEVPDFFDPRDAFVPDRRAERTVEPKYERLAEQLDLQEEARAERLKRLNSEGRLPPERHPNSFVAVAARMLAEGRFAPKPAPIEIDDSGEWAI